MAARKKSKKPSTLARRAPPDVYVAEDDRAYIRVPLAPHIVTAFREHAENGSRLLELVTGAEADAAGVFAQIAKTAAALERDLTKVRARLRRSAKAR